MSQKVVVVGYCASGKSTLVDSLRSRGVDASVVAQEHSIIENLWDHSSPDVVIFLDVSLDNVRERRDNPDWPQWIYDVQSKRLSRARDRADLIVDTNASDVDATFSEVSRYLELTNDS